MEEMNKLGRNQFFLYAIDRIETLEKLTAAQVTFGNYYDPIVYDYICGNQGKICEDAISSWAATLPRFFKKLVNEGGDFGYDASRCLRSMVMVYNQLFSYSLAVQQVVARSSAYLSKEISPLKPLAPSLFT